MEEVVPVMCKAQSTFPLQRQAFVSIPNVEFIDIGKQEEFKQGVKYFKNIHTIL